MNRAEKRQLEKDVAYSKRVVKSHLDFLNAVGNPKYELRKISPLKAKIKRWLRIK